MPIKKMARKQKAFKRNNIELMKLGVLEFVLHFCSLKALRIYLSEFVAQTGTEKLYVWNYD